MTNPYQSPQSPLGDAEYEPMRPPPPHFTHITVNGCNLLGLANFFAYVGLSYLSLCIAPTSRFLGIALAVLTFCCCCGFDLMLRLRSPGRGRVMQLLSPHAGGALFFAPVWLIYPSVIVAGVVGFLTKG